MSIGATSPDASRNEARVVIAGGHMVDGRGRRESRFPATEIPRVAEAIDRAMTAWRVGRQTTLITGGARGADLLAAEAALRRDARIRFCLPSPVADFERTSVDLPGTGWHTRFRRLLQSAEVEVLAPSPTMGSSFQRVNDRILELAFALDARPHVLVVWDGRPGDGPGGTSDLVARVRLDLPDRLWVINPRPCAPREH